MRTELLNSLPTELHIRGEWESRMVEIDDEFLEPKYSIKIRNHSPDGFNWGYSGSGPAQLALAILMKYLPVENALHLYQNFKFRIIAGLPQSDFDTRIDLRKIISELSNKKAG